MAARSLINERLRCPLYASALALQLSVIFQSPGAPMPISMAVRRIVVCHCAQSSHRQVNAQVNRPNRKVKNRWIRRRSGVRLFVHPLSFRWTYGCEWRGERTGVVRWEMANIDGALR